MNAACGSPAGGRPLWVKTVRLRGDPGEGLRAIITGEALTRITQGASQTTSNEHTFPSFASFPGRQPCKTRMKQGNIKKRYVMHLYTPVRKPCKERGYKEISIKTLLMYICTYIKKQRKERGNKEI